MNLLNPIKQKKGVFLGRIHLRKKQEHELKLH